MQFNEKNCYDLIVIGGGPGGYLAAQRAAEKGLRAIVFEKNSFGGVCLNEGCIPTKALLYSAKIYDYLKHPQTYGIETGAALYNHKSVVEKKERTVRRLVGGIKAQLKAHGVETVTGLAEILPKENDLFAVSCEASLYYSKNLIIASGSIPVIPPIKGLNEQIKAGFVLTSREILQLGINPESLLVIGGGVIGLEMASYFASTGSKVVVVEMADKIGGQLENAVSAALQRILEKKGIEFILNARVTAFGEKSVTYERDGAECVLDAEIALLSIGRKPCLGFGLEVLNVKTERGAIITDEKMRTNVAGLYAVGDVNGKSMLAHTAYREAEVAVNVIMGKDDAMNYHSVPSVIYTNPEASSCGETPESAAVKGINAKYKDLSMMYSGRYVAENGDPAGFARLVVNADDNTLIGFHALSSYASEYISVASALIDLNIDVERAKKIIFPHPTVSEIFHEILFTLDE